MTISPGVVALVKSSLVFVLECRMFCFQHGGLVGFGDVVGVQWPITWFWFASDDGGNTHG